MENQQYPLVSFVILAYNQEKYIEECVCGAFAQDYPNMEIILSDDCSTDSTFEIMRRLVDEYKGPHMVILNRNEKNLGLSAHHVKVTSMCHGVFRMGNGGDDFSVPNRVSLSVKALLASNVDAISFNINRIDSDSNHIGVAFKDTDYSPEEYHLADFLNGEYHTSGASRIVRQTLYDDFGPLLPDCQTEDTTTVFRCFLRNGMGFNYTPVVNYRIHSDNLSGHDNLMRKFNPQKISKQYRHDLETARVRGFVTDEEYKQVQKYIDHYLAWNLAIREVYFASKWKKTLVICKYLRNPNLSLREVLCLTPLRGLLKKDKKGDD